MKEAQKAGNYKASGSKRKKAKRRCRRLIGLLLLLLVTGAAWFYVDSLAYKVCRVEAGVAVSPSDFMKNEDPEAYFTENSQPFSTLEPGEYLVKVKSGLFTHSCTLIVEDTIPPKGEAVAVTLEVGSTCGADSFVTGIVDATAVTVTFVEEPDFAKAGSQSVQVCLTDRGGNETVLGTELFICPVVKEVTVEAGQEAPSLEDFVLAGNSAAFLSAVDTIDYTVVCDHPIKIQVDGESYTSILHIKDTIPPKVQVQDIEGFALLERSAEEFVVSVDDVTAVTASFKQEPDLGLIGTQTVTIVFTDDGGNTTEAQAKLTLFADTEPPVISGAKDLFVFVGDSVSYKRNVTVTDNCPDGVELTVDAAGVNVNAEGVYPVTYTAVDAAGNTASVTVNLTVSARMYDIETVNALADAVLAQIITPEMSDMDKVQAIYNYNKTHIAYISHSEKGDWVRAAYEGLAENKGDCYVYACTAKVLLTRAGIKNMDIAKIPSRTEHYWNLVDVGDGWYHFDTTPRKDHPTIFMWTDEEMMAYSAKHNNSHNYDHSLYPEVN